MRTNEPRMPTDEQRMREKFEASGLTSRPLHLHGFIWEGFRGGYRSRDAEVQALKHVLTELTDCAEDATKRLSYPRGSLDYAIWQARTALAGGETGETE